MTLIMVLIIYIGSLCLLSCYNFFKIGHFWRSNYSALNRKWFFLYSLIIEGVVLILLPHIRYLFNEPYVNTTLGTIVFVFILIICNTITQFIGIKRLFDIGVSSFMGYLKDKLFSIVIFCILMPIWIDIILIKLYYLYVKGLMCCTNYKQEVLTWIAKQLMYYGLMN